VEVAVNLKKIVAWLVVAFVVFYVIQAPEQSAQIVKNAGEALGDAASSLADFVGSLV
jgi:large-conductance mechanosensitive channel